MIKFWQLLIEQDAKKQFLKLPKNLQSRILDYFEDRILIAPDPLVFASPLSGTMAGLHRFRIGDYRVITNINKGNLIIVAVAFGHRKDIYRKTRH